MQIVQTVELAEVSIRVVIVAFMLLVIDLGVIEIVLRSLWSFFSFIKLMKQVIEEAIEIWVVLDSLNILTLSVDNFLELLLGSNMGNLNRERKLCLMD